MKLLCQGDCLRYLRNLAPGMQFNCIFADPPDNLGLQYDGFIDKKSDYYDWIAELLLLSVPRAPVVWFSYYYKHDLEVKNTLFDLVKRYRRDVRQYIWRFGFGQYRETDSPNGYRPILRISHPDWKPLMTERVRSVREEMGDSRASGRGRVPDDVWDYSRVQGNSKERRPWHPTQHPEDLYRRIMRMSIPIVDGKRRGTFVDLFAGTGTCFRVAWDDITVLGVEISEAYCDYIAREHGISGEDVFTCANRCYDT